MTTPGPMSISIPAPRRRDFVGQVQIHIEHGRRFSRFQHHFMGTPDLLE
jgi:hypothetical protein